MDEWSPTPEERGWLEPPRRRPPTAIGVATPPPPPGPRRSQHKTRLQRIGLMFAQLSVATALGLAAAAFVSMPLMLSLLATLTGGRWILQRQHSRVLRCILYFGSSAPRRAA